jgi:O-antigen biosynthesis protein
MMHVHAPTRDPVSSAHRPAVSGKFLYVGEHRFDVRGVTYGTFRPDTGGDYPDRDVVETDFALMAEYGVNAIRTYTVPPPWLLDLAGAAGLQVMVGLPWEQHVAFLDDRRRLRSIEQRVRDGVRGCARHPAVLCFAVGNEIPAPVVRWHGRRAVERFVERLYWAAKDEDPDALVTYANYPSTEYLQLPFLDLAAFNVYLETDEQFDSYLARLQSIAGDRPLLMAEIGLDSRRNGEVEQARVISRQMQASLAAGCAGVFVFAWTDEWYRGGTDVEDWDFGLTDRRREPKQALHAVRRASREPILEDGLCPAVSVVLCSHNGERTIARCLAGLTALDYPSYEIIVVDDGSTDATARIAAGFDVHLICTDNRGLSNARNTGVAAARGEIVAFIDDDAWPDPRWLRYLTATLIASDHAGVGGPNIPPPADGLVGAAVARAPGIPIHVLASDTEAEHIPGCNMAFWRDALESVDGFDPRFRVAGDDVDVCWKLQDRAMTLGFSPGAVVWHRRRHSFCGYLKQQYAYGKAEALLERKWPEKYNRGGHVRWAARVYADARSALVRRRLKVNYGTWGRHAFQSLYQGPTSAPWALPLMPEWYLLVGALGALAIQDVARRPLLATVPGVGLPLEVVLLVAAVAALVGLAVGAGRDAVMSSPRARRRQPLLRAMTMLLYALQPLARLAGRLRHGLTPWRRRGGAGFAGPWHATTVQWSEQWRSPYARLLEIENRLRPRCLSVARGGDHDRWDLQVGTGQFAAARLRLLAEEHGEGRQLLRFAIAPRCSVAGLLAVVPCVAALATAFSHDLVAAVFFGVAALVIAARVIYDGGSARATLQWAIDPQRASADDVPAAERAPEHGLRVADQHEDRQRWVPIDAVLRSDIPPVGRRPEL